MDVPTHHKIWAESLAYTLINADDLHLWYSRVCDDLFVRYACKQDTLVQIFADLFYFTDSMVFTALGQGTIQAEATMDLMNDLLNHVCQRLVTDYFYSYVEVTSLSRTQTQNA